MSIWKDLLLHGGFIATPLALRHVVPELIAPVASSRTDTPVQERAARPPWARVAVDHLLIR
jgi:hypothetical protein